MRPLLSTFLLCAPALVAQAPSPAAGDWAGALQLPGAELKLSVTLTLNAGAWTGLISIPAQGAKDLPLADIKVGAGQVAFALANIPGDPRFQGRLVGATRLEGSLTQGGQSFPMVLERSAVTATVQAPRRERKDRELAFPGFNAFPLKGSVLAGGGHPHFAVMVAGSGPTDRDWSTPLIPMPSHGGRDLADWLQSQGIGSLRYDKRFIGSKDPKLDISVDAQVGDIKAALKAARALPEAKGKKLLLVGHSEGALLSLLTASDADAVLLLAMPGMSMGASILAQVKAQFLGVGAPAEITTQNMAFLQASLEAIRKDRDLPQAGAGVDPGIVGLAKGLARPESRGYLRDTLDLDPWAAARRLVVPCAVVWGDRDVQTWRPEVMPADFKGTVVQIPEANHMFRRETRPRAELNGANAMSTYGDSAPMADLSPVAVWLKALK